MKQENNEIEERLNVSIYDAQKIDLIYYIEYVESCIKDSRIPDTYAQWLQP